MALYFNGKGLSLLFTRVCCRRNLRKIKEALSLVAHGRAVGDFGNEFSSSHVRIPTNIPVGPVSYHTSATCQGLASDENCGVVLGVTRDCHTVVCFHRAKDIAFELTKNIPRPDLINHPAETHDLVLKSKLTGEILKDKQSPTIEELSKMFHTTKHCWYPVGQYHVRRKNKNPPKDR